MILIRPEEIDVDNRCRLDGTRARHIRKVLKAEAGKQLRIGMLDGPMGSGEVLQVDGDTVTLQCTFAPDPPAYPCVDLLLALPRPKVMKRLWAQLAALGVGRIVLLRADKVERFYFDSHVLDPDFYSGLLIEGLQQARCTHLPEVLVRPLFKPFVEDELDSLVNGQLKLLADPSGDQRLGDLVSGAGDAERVVLAIGPEGGWTPYELELLQEHGFELFSLGKRMLRTDTATVGLLAILHEMLSRSGV